jgi:hypothetical protein
MERETVMAIGWRVVAALIVGIVLVVVCGCARRVTVAPVETPTPIVVAVATPDPYAYTVVKPGDTLGGIAGEGYERGMMWPLVWRANRDEVTYPDLIEVGWELRVPKRPGAVECLEALDTAVGWPEYRGVVQDIKGVE